MNILYTMPYTQRNKKMDMKNKTHVKKKLSFVLFSWVKLELGHPIGVIYEV